MMRDDFKPSTINLIGLVGNVAIQNVEEQRVVQEQSQTKLSILAWLLILQQQLKVVLDMIII